MSLDSMSNIILDRKKDPLGSMMLDYLHGDLDACVEVDSTTLEMSTMCGEVMFRTSSQMDELELLAMGFCKGNILDVGAGSGCHSLYLQNNGRNVDALDISPGCVEVMRELKLKHVLHQNLFSLSGQKYDTILMLMNGLGISGTIAGLGELLQHLQTLLADGGQVIADSTDLTPLFQHVEQYEMFDSYFGETEFVMSYRDAVSEPFPWLYVDFETLKSIAESHGFICEQLLELEGSRYLTRIYQPPTSRK